MMHKPKKIDSKRGRNISFNSNIDNEKCLKQSSRKITMLKTSSLTRLDTKSHHNVFSAIHPATCHEMNDEEMLVLCFISTLIRISKLSDAEKAIEEYSKKQSLSLMTQAYMSQFKGVIGLFQNQGSKSNTEHFGLAEKYFKAINKEKCQILCNYVILHLKIANKLDVPKSRDSKIGKDKLFKNQPDNENKNEKKRSTVASTTLRTLAMKVKRLKYFSQSGGNIFVTQKAKKYIELLKQRATDESIRFVDLLKLEKFNYLAFKNQNHLAICKAIMQNEDLMVLTEVKPNKKDYTSATIASNAVEKTNSMTGTKDGIIQSVELNKSMPRKHKIGLLKTVNKK